MELNEAQKRAKELREQNLRSNAREKLKNREKSINNQSPKKSNKGRITIAVILLVIISGYFIYNSFPSVKNQKKVNALFIKETGENIVLRDTAKQLLKYPETYEHKKTIRQTIADRNIFIQTNFTGKNGFNIPERFCLEMIISQSGEKISTPIMCNNMDLN